MPSGLGEHIWSAGVLGNLHDAGIAVATCTAGLEQEAFFASCLTARTAFRALQVMQRSVTSLPVALRVELGGVDWAAWEDLGAILPPLTAAQRDRVWFAVGALVPAVLMALRRLRRRQPQRFNPAGFRP